MPHDEQQTPPRRRFLAWLVLLYPLLAALFLLSLYGAAVKHSVFCWVAAAVLFVLLFVLGTYSTWHLVKFMLLQFRREQEHLQSGKVILSFWESLASRIIVDGFQKTLVSAMRLTLASIRQWTLLLLVLLTIGAIIKFDLRVFIEAGPRAIGIGILIGGFIGIVIALAGRTLRVVEGKTVSLDIIATTSYTWPLNEIEAARVVPAASSRVAIEIDFATSRQKLSSIRFVARASAGDLDDLRRILGISESPATEAGD